MQITYIVCPGRQRVAERLLRFLATPFGPIGVCSLAQQWSRCWLAGVDGWKEARQQSGSQSVHADESKAQCLSVPASETPSCLLALLLLPISWHWAPHTQLHHHSHLPAAPAFLPAPSPPQPCTTFCLQSCRSVCAPSFFTESRDSAARAE